MLCILLEADPIAVWGLFVAIIGVVVGLVAAVAAIYAAVYAKAAPTKEDLERIEGNTADASSKLDEVETHLAVMKEDIKRVEGNTAEASEHLENVHSGIRHMNERIDTQHERDALNARINRVALRVMGDVEQTKDAQFSITKKDENVVLNRVDLYNEWGYNFGSAPCEELGPNQVLVKLDREAFMTWYRAGSLVGNLNQDRSLYLRVYFTFKGLAEELPRSITVLAEIVRPSVIGQTITPQYYRLSGEV